MSYLCLMYHEISAPCKNKYTISPDQFEEQLKLFVSLGVQSYDFKSHINDSQKSVLFTFDDGHQSHYEAAKLLAKYGYKGYFFVIKSYSLGAKNGYLSESEIKEISLMGHYIGVHGYDHGHWTEKNNLLAEITETKEWIEGIIQKEVTSCAAPGGVIDDTVINMIKKNFPEFNFFRTVRVGINKKNDYLIKIVPIHTATSLYELKKLITCNPLFWLRQYMVYYFKECVKYLISKI